MATAAVTTNRTESLQRQLPDWLATLLEQTIAAFGRTGKVTPLEAEAYLESWAGLVRKFGRQRFEKALKRAIAESPFFPKSEAISSRIPSGMKLIGVSDPNCKRCGGTSWERVFEGLTIGAEDRPGKPVHPNLGALRRCKCWRVVEAA